MTPIPISQFEHRVARWITRLKKQRAPLHITQRGKPTLVVQLFEEWSAEQDKTQALELRLLIAAGERDIALGRTYTHEQVGRMMGIIPPKKRKARR